MGYKNKIILRNVLCFSFIPRHTCCPALVVRWQPAVSLQCCMYWVLDVDTNLSWTQGILSVCHPTELREYHPEPPRPQGHQSTLPRLHGEDCEKASIYGGVPISYLTFFGVNTGNFPCKGSTGVRNQDGWGCFSKEGRSDTSRSAGIRIGEGGIVSDVPPPGPRSIVHFGSSSFSGCSREPTGRIGVVRPAAERC